MNATSRLAQNMSKNAPYIILAEDDFRHAQRLQTKLQREFPSGRIERIKSEHEFGTSLDKFALDPPDVVVMDVMLRWAISSPDMPPCPNDVKRDGYHRAGFRCIDSLAKRDATKKIPCVIYTVLERADLDSKFGTLPPGTRVEYLRKEADHENLLELIGDILKNKKSQN